MIVGMILEPIPATAISFIAVTVSVLSANWVLFGAQELAEPGFKAGKEALKWGLAGFSSTTVWLVFGAFIFALGYEATGLGRRIALFPVKFMGKRTLTLGYAVVIIDILLAPFTPSNTARTGGTVFPVVKTCRRCSIPSPTILFTPHRRLPDVDDGGRHQHQLLDVRHRRRAERAGHRVRRQDRRGAHQLDAVVPGVPAGRPAAADHRAADLLLPVQTGRDPQQRSGRPGGYRAGEMGKLTRKEYTLIGRCCSACACGCSAANAGRYRGVSAGGVTDAGAARGVVERDHKYSSARNTLVNPATLVVMANGLTRSGFIDWFAQTMSTHRTASRRT